MIDKDWEEKLMQNTISHGTGFMRMSLNKNGGIDVDVVDPKDYRYHIREPQISFNSEVVGHIEPQPRWVGLTDDDKVLIKHDANFNQFMTAGEYADRVQELTEARLKDKNHLFWEGDTYNL